jgi:hypothetical protein
MACGAALLGFAMFVDVLYPDAPRIAALAIASYGLFFMAASIVMALLEVLIRIERHNDDPRHDGRE